MIEGTDGPKDQLMKLLRTLRVVYILGLFLEACYEESESIDFQVVESSNLTNTDLISSKQLFAKECYEQCRKIGRCNYFILGHSLVDG